MNRAEAEAKILDVADRLFYGQGVGAVGMKEIRDASGVALKRLYQCFRSKDELVAAYLGRRDRTWRDELRDFVLTHATDPRERILLVFDSLESWFSDPHFRGCAFVNAVGELGRTHPEIARMAREHKAALRSFLGELLRDAGVTDPEAVARQMMILVDGSITAAAIYEGPSAAGQARTMAAHLLDTGARPHPS